MTLTSPACPVAESLPIQVEDQVNQIEGVWEFFSGSSVDLEALLHEARETRLLTPGQKRKLLERHPSCGAGLDR